MNEITFLTYPRSGKHWLNWNLDKTIKDLKINYAHLWNDVTEPSYLNILNKKIVTVVRNPYDCLASIVAMEFLGSLDRRVKDYIDHYEFFIEKAEMFFKYEDINKIEEISNIIVKNFGGSRFLSTSDYGGYEEYKSWYTHTQHPRKFITSTDQQEYSEAKKIVDNFVKNNKPLYDKLNLLYDQAFSKCEVL
jgi:hypothetical protein